MPMVGLKRASELTGKSQSTIHRAMKSGRLSYGLDSMGKMVIDVSELNRVYQVTPIDGKQMESGFQSSCHDSDRSEMMELRSMLESERLKVNMLEKRVKELEEIKTDLREDRDHWRKQAEQFTRLLSDQRQKPEESEKQRKGLLSRLFELPLKILGG